ncbi:hypothetical protein F0562_003889 [Nyssa sinensis]|uniref:AB hydrolase-1 domain-containing protein n=1 Tax=Nyssa sinensis TaxID=561372 RepID=A0A5J5C009_9ASTE|nr:hypothetical protein F0562_003889 [Nyssa sinensis]
MDKEERHFVLVHGACHGAWCWYKVATLLRSAGHRVTALDLAASGIHPKRMAELRSVSDHFEPLTEFMESLPPDDRVVLVGHSMGGIAVSVAMERFPQKICVAIFVTAFMPGPNFNLPTLALEYNRRLDSYLDSEFRFEGGFDKPPTSILFGPEFLSAKLYNLSAPEDLTLATLLVKPVATFEEADVLKETTLTKERYGSVNRVYIVSEQDKVIKEDLQRWMIENNPTDEVKVIYDSDHMVMFSKPQELCSCLKEIADNY